MPYVAISRVQDKMLKAFLRQNLPTKNRNRLHHKDRTRACSGLAQGLHKTSIHAIIAEEPAHDSASLLIGKAQGVTNSNSESSTDTSRGGDSEARVLL